MKFNLTIKIMKPFLRFLSLLMLVMILASQILIAQRKKNFYGSWNFDAPYAPPSYQIGVMTITSDSVFTKYPGETLILTSSNYNFKNDTLTFIFITDVDVTFTLGYKNKNILSGKVTWLSDESTITLTRIEKTKSKKQKAK